MANNLTRTFLVSSRVVQTSFARTLATGQGKSPMDYVKQGVDQLSQAAEKVKEAASNATSTVVGAVTGDYNTSKLINKKVEDAKIHGNRAADNFRNAADEAQRRSGYETTSSGSSRSDNFTSGQTTTDKIKDKANEYVQQAKSTANAASSTAKSYANQAANKAREVADDVASSTKNAANRASEWVKETKDELSSDSKRNADAAINKARDTIKSGADSVKSGANKVASEAKSKQERS
ncbi:unnamed protein product [Rotaria sp. Silwood2]|nr:unnamed protein product [Rotaria sp. Silwood2]CAF4226839.1 unnamed protein product [Rotaria sp. Silwood2]